MFGSRKDPQGTQAPVSSRKILRLCFQAKYHLDAEWAERVHLFASNEYNVWWRRFFRWCGIKTVTAEELVEIGWHHQIHRRNERFQPAELWNGSFWLTRDEDTVNRVQQLTKLSNGDVYLDSEDLSTIQEWAAGK